MVVTAVTVAVIDPVIFAVLVVVFAVVFLIWRYVSLASVIAAFVYPGAVYISAQIRSGGQGTPYLTAILFSTFVGLLIIFLHRENIKRIYNKTESKVHFRKNKRLPDADVPEEAPRPHVKGRGKKKSSSTRSRRLNARELSALCGGYRFGLPAPPLRRFACIVQRKRAGLCFLQTMRKLPANMSFAPSGGIFIFHQGKSKETMRRPHERDGRSPLC